MMKYILILIVMGWAGGVDIEYLGYYGTKQRCERASEYGRKTLLDVPHIIASFRCIKSTRTQ